MPQFVLKQRQFRVQRQHATAVGSHGRFFDGERDSPKIAMLDDQPGKPPLLELLTVLYWNCLLS